MTRCGKTGGTATPVGGDALTRVRRIMYNDDGCGPCFTAEGATPDGFLRGPTARMSAVPGTQVDSVFICSGATHALNHPSSVAETYADTIERYGVTEWQMVRDTLWSLFAAGTDPIRLTVDFCRQRGIEVFYSHRINDLHLGFLDGERSTWWREHPEYRLGTAAGVREQDVGKAGKYTVTDPKYWGWSALNFEVPEVRAYLLSILEDVANRYEVDGLEIDYLRAPLFFLPNLELKPATKEQLNILTGFQSRVRQIAEGAGRKRGRPMLVAARVPTMVSRCRHVGIDIERWLEEGLLDVMATGGGYVPFSMAAGEMVKLGHKHNVPVYPVISASGMRGRYDCIEAWRGAAANAWRAGADGVYLFNHFPNQPSPQFKELGDPKKLAAMDKLFAVENDRSGYWGHYICLLDSSAAVNDPHSYGADIGVMPRSRLLPVTIETSEDGTVVVLPIGDDIPSAAKKGTLHSAVMKVQVSDSEIMDSVEVRLNGHVLSPVDDMSVHDLQSEPTYWRELDNTWRFATDPGNKGVQERWYDPGYSDPAWAIVRSDTGNGWESQGFTGYYGVGWYRQKFMVHEDMLERMAVWMLFGGVDKQAEVYLNGKPVFSHTEKSTGLPPEQLWNRPFVFNARGFLELGENTLAVRVQSTMYQAGVYRPVYLLLQDETPDPKRTLDDILVKDAEKRRLTFKPEPSLYRMGDNKVSIRSTSPTGDGKRPAQLTEVEVHVKYRLLRVK